MATFSGPPWQCNLSPTRLASCPDLSPSSLGRHSPLRPPFKIGDGVARWRELERSPQTRQANRIRRGAISGACNKVAPPLRRFFSSNGQASPTHQRTARLGGLRSRLLAWICIRGDSFFDRHECLPCLETSYIDSARRQPTPWVATFLKEGSFRRGNSSGARQKLKRALRELPRLQWWDEKRLFLKFALTRYDESCH